MVDVRLIRASSDIRDYISLAGMKRVATTGGGEWAGPCPFCGGRDRFRVQPDNPHYQQWLCRGCADAKWKDIIEFIMRKDNCGFFKACEILSSDVDCPPLVRPAALKPREIEAPPNAEWQGVAREFIRDCETTLWSPKGQLARAWLHDRRLRDDTLKRWHIGYNPRPRPYRGLFAARGIVIPCEVDGVLWNVKIRSFEGEDGYSQLKGGNKALFGTETLVGRTVTFICEGEFDTMLLSQEAGHRIGAVTLGSAAYPLAPRPWALYLLPMPHIYVAYDADNAGRRGAAGLIGRYPRMRRVEVPQLRPKDKDITDYAIAGGCLDLFVLGVLSGAVSGRAE